VCISVFQERKVYNEEYDVRIFRLLMAASKIGDMDTLRGFVFSLIFSVFVVLLVELDQMFIYTCI
jgi:hypothetical protein